MAQIILTLPDVENAEWVESVCHERGYQKEVPNPDFDSGKPVDAVSNPLTIPNKVSPGEFVQQCFVSEMQRSVNRLRQIKRDAAIPPLVTYDAKGVSIEVK